MERQRIIADIDRAFGRTERPERFLRDPDHCDTCSLQEAKLRRLCRDTVTLQDLSKPGDGRFCPLVDQALDYLMPGLARRALERVDDRALGLFLWYLERRIEMLTPIQLDAVTSLLDHLYDTTPTTASRPEDPTSSD